MLDFVKSATCLVLDKRMGEFYELESSFNKLFPDKKLKRFLGGSGDTEGWGNFDRIDTNELPPIFPTTTSYATWRNKPGAFNAWKCHAQIFMEFLWTNEEYLWLMEDDCVFTEDALEIIDRCHFPKTVNFDGLYLGYYSNGNLIDIKADPLRKAKGVAGFHSVILSRESVIALLGITNFKPVGPFDETCQRLHTLRRFLCIYPQICLQRSGYSHVEQGILEKPDRYKI